MLQYGHINTKRLLIFFSYTVNANLLCDETRIFWVIYRITSCCFCSFQRKDYKRQRLSFYLFEFDFVTASSLDL